MRISVHILALVAALFCFVLHIIAEGWTPATAATRSGTRPNLLALGLAFWVFGQIVGSG